MKLFLIGFLGAGLGLAAQAPQAAVRVGAPGASAVGARAGNVVGKAILGFFPGPGPSELNTILGIFGAARVGEPVLVPETVSRLYLSTRQRYALVEQNSSGALAVWALSETGNGEPVSLAGALTHADLVAFSPRGDAAALYARDSGQVQVIGGLPSKPVIQKIPAVESPGAITMMAVSDDATVLVTRDSVGTVQISTGGGTWQPFYGAYSPAAWTFVPRTHDLAISDSQENAVFLVEQAGAKNARVVLAENCSADQLHATSDGETLVALDSRRSMLWTVDLKSHVSRVTASTRNLNSLIALRSGSTFLAPSRDGGMTLLKVSENGAIETATIPAAAGR